MGDRRRSHRVLEDPRHVAPPFGTERVDASDEHAPDPLLEAVEGGRVEGYRQGRERASEEMARELEGVRRELASSLERLANLESILSQRFEARLLEIAIEAASSIARQRVEAGDPIAARALEEALATLPDSTSVRARLHPEDLGVVEQSLRAELQAGRLELVADETLPRGGTIVECDAGRVDATIDTAEQAVRAAVVGAEDAE